MLSVLLKCSVLLQPAAGPIRHCTLCLFKLCPRFGPEASKSLEITYGFLLVSAIDLTSNTCTYANFFAFNGFRARKRLVKGIRIAGLSAFFSAIQVNPPMPQLAFTLCCLPNMMTLLQAAVF